ncbi:PilZ domain-containing protein [Sphingomonas sp. LM7]|uniref:PilZ domain-containing protein n=1 Tax=Sphingomonas sp. LM7 TaxID=1938607 RepID=UPI000983CA04|nr:PilZ domain-containing protein [Sphingomonas sp. LM7]AQR72968.1 hypothetical protein BXU08_04120 [Sphingomonas sp. LM7]
MLTIVKLKTKQSNVMRASWADRRSSERLSTCLKAELRGRGTSRRIKAEVVDVSVTGCRLLTWACRLGDEVLVAIGHLSPVPAQVCWVHNGAIGVRFATKLHPSIVSHLAKL